MDPTAERQGLSVTLRVGELLLSQLRTDRSLPHPRGSPRRWLGSLRNPRPISYQSREEVSPWREVLNGEYGQLFPCSPRVSFRSTRI